MTRSFALFALALLASISFFGCESDCVYPNTQTFRLRLVNAMPDQAKITVFINGKRFHHDYAYAPSTDFGYSSVLEDGNPLPLGSLFIVVTRDAAGTDTIHTGFISPNLHRQTLIIMGRAKPLVASDDSLATHLLLDDEDVLPDRDSIKIRVVHAVDDLPALDIYFKGLSADGAPSGNPDISLSYGEVSKRLSIRGLPGLTITEAGNPRNIIFSASTPFQGADFVITTVIRGASKPCATEPVPAPFLLSDGGVGLYILDFPVFGVRLVNGTRNDTLCLSASNPGVSDPRFNISGQRKVFFIPPDSASEFFGVGATQFANTRWYFLTDTVVRDTVHGMQHVAKANERWTFVAFQDAANAYQHLILRDSMECVPEAFAKVRVVNLSPQSGQVTVEIGSATPLSLSQGQVGFVTLPAGAKSIRISSGALSQTHTVPLPPARPISLYVLPAKGGASFPVTISPD